MIKASTGSGARSYLRPVAELQNIISDMKAGNFKAIARAISVVENKSEGFNAILESLQHNMHIPVVGFTGAPGAGKSSIVNALAELWLQQNLKIAVIAVDPASPFNLGALLGDRIRMGGLFTNPNLFIRSISTRGSLGGLSASIIEITDIFRNAGFDRIMIETVGVGQSEVEIAGIADCTVVVTVPEGGDDIQAMKSGVMEIADIFVVNKSDREGADRFAMHLKQLSENVPVIQTIAVSKEGITELSEAILHHFQNDPSNDRKYLLLAEKLEQLVIRERMKDFDTLKIAAELKEAMNNPDFNLYLYSKRFTHS